jgi:LmbE family N-acetylglucosaminyl deacetylase
MYNHNRVLAIGAHPDDIEYSCLGYLLKLKGKGSKIFSYIASNGSSGDPTSGEIRIRETKSSLACLECLTFVENKSGISILDYEEYSNKIRAIIIDFKPSLILIHSIHDTHQEHRLLRDITMTAVRRLPCTILSYASVSVTNTFNPNYFVSIDDFMELKIRALQSHSSQSTQHYMNPLMIKQFHQSWQLKMKGYQYAESYCLEQAYI